jgi:hypothetical protein
MLNAVRVWICLSTLLVASGWILSALHQLNRLGYGFVFALSAITAVLWQKKIRWRLQKTPSEGWRKFQKRFKRPAPFLFLLAAVMSFFGGILYVPSDSDSLSYRIPRVLHWLAAEQWHWIRTFDWRFNVAGTGYEWLSAPLIAFARTDRLLFLIDWISFLLLPCLIFCLFKRLKISKRVAWWWMWLLPVGGYCFVLQAETTQNEILGTVYGLSAVCLALQAAESGAIFDFWLSMLAVALLTNVKQTDIPLALLWLVASWRCAGLVLKRPIATIGITTISLLVSILLITILNFQHAGNWMGIPADSAFLKDCILNSAFWGIIGNAFCLTAQNFRPPIFPWAQAWNQGMQTFLRTNFGAHFKSFESFGFLNFHVDSQTAGIGLGICSFIIISVIWARSLKIKPGSPEIKRNIILWLLQALPWVLLLAFMAKVGTYQNARQLAPYYVFLVPSLLAPLAHLDLTRKHLWKWMACIVMLASIALVFTSHLHPMFPARTISTWLRDRCPHSKLAVEIGALYAYRADIEAERNLFESDLPPNTSVVGMALPGDIEVGFWFPLGQRRVIEILPHDTPKELHSLGIEYVVVKGASLRIVNKTICQWMTQYNAELIKDLSFAGEFGKPPDHIYLVRLNSFFSSPETKLAD